MLAKPRWITNKPVFICLFGISAQKGHCSQTYAPGKLQQRCAHTLFKYMFWLVVSNFWWVSPLSYLGYWSQLAIESLWRVKPSTSFRWFCHSPMSPKTENGPHRRVHSSQLWMGKPIRKGFRCPSLIFLGFLFSNSDARVMAATKVYLAVGVASGRQKWPWDSYFQRREVRTRRWLEYTWRVFVPCLAPQELLGYADMPGLRQLLWINWGVDCTHCCWLLAWQIGPCLGSRVVSLFMLFPLKFQSLVNRSCSWYVAPLNFVPRLFGSDFAAQSKHDKWIQVDQMIKWEHHQSATKEHRPNTSSTAQP